LRHADFLFVRHGNCTSDREAERSVFPKIILITLPMTQRKAVGIDLGTTFSAVAHIDPYGKPQIIPNSESERITPSVILYDGGNVIVGTLAKNNSVAEPERIVDFLRGVAQGEAALSGAVAPSLPSCCRTRLQPF